MNKMKEEYIFDVYKNQQGFLVDELLVEKELSKLYSELSEPNLKNIIVAPYSSDHILPNNYIMEITVKDRLSVLKMRSILDQSEYCLYHLRENKLSFNNPERIQKDSRVIQFYSPLSLVK